MTDDPIRQLLKRADGAAPLPAGAGDLAGRVRTRVARRRAVTATAAGIAVIVVGAMFFRFHSPSGGPNRPDHLAIGTTQPKPPHTPTPAEVAGVQLDGDIHAQIAEKMWSTQRQRDRLAAAGARPDPLEYLAQQRDRAALIVIDRGDQFAQQRQLTPAADEYRNAIKLFPETHWAAAARQRLAALEQRKEG